MSTFYHLIKNIIKIILLFTQRPKLRFDISARMKSNKSDKTKATEAMHANIDQERKYMIDTAIVRVMKMRRTLQHQMLITEVITQVSSRFTPSVPIIKVHTKRSKSFSPI